MDEVRTQPSGGGDLPRLRGPRGRPLRVLHVTTVDMSLALLLGTELRAVAGTGVDVHVASAPGPWVADVERLGVTHHPVRSFRRDWAVADDLRAAVQLASLVRRLEPDVVHTHTPKPGVVGRPLARVLGVPVVVNTCHGLWVRPGQRRAVRAAVLLVEGLASLCSHAELYQNAEDAGRLRRWAGGRQRVVGNGIDLARFAPDPLARARLRSRWGVDDTTLLVGGVGRMVAEKGVLDLAAATAGLGQEVEVVWVGAADDSKPDAVAATPSGIRWLGPQPDMPAVYNALDVFVLPSYREGFSRSAMEAAATGLPMVLSDIRGCRELGQHDRDLLLVPPGDPSALADAITRLHHDAELRTRLGRAARARALEEYDQLQVACRSLATYEEVARRRGLRWSEVAATGERTR